MSADSLPITPLVITIVPALMADVMKNQKVPVKRMVAAFLYGTMVWLLASWRMDIATAFAWVGAATSILVNGKVVFDVVNKVV